MKHSIQTCVLFLSTLQNADAFAPQPNRNSDSSSLTFNNSYLERLRNDEVKAEKNPSNDEQVAPLTSTSQPSRHSTIRNTPQPADGKGRGTVSTVDYSQAFSETSTDRKLYSEASNGKSHVDNRDWGYGAEKAPVTSPRQPTQSAMYDAPRPSRPSDNTFPGTFSNHFPTPNLFRENISNLYSAVVDVPFKTDNSFDSPDEVELNYKNHRSPSSDVETSPVTPPSPSNVNNASQTQVASNNNTKSPYNFKENINNLYSAVADTSSQSSHDLGIIPHSESSSSFGIIPINNSSNGSSGLGARTVQKPLKDFLTNLRNDEVRERTASPSIDPTSPVLSDARPASPAPHVNTPEPFGGSARGTVSITNPIQVTRETSTDSRFYSEPFNDPTQTSNSLGIIDARQTESNVDIVPRNKSIEVTNSLAIAKVSSIDKDASTDEFSGNAPILVRGDSMETRSFEESVQRVYVFLETDGQPLNADVELWQFENSPQKLTVHLEDGCIRPFRAIIESPGTCNSVAIRNTGSKDFPFRAGLEGDALEDLNTSEILLNQTGKRTVQGGSSYPISLPPDVQSAQVILKTDGRPMHARVELSKGPNNSKQIMEIYTEDGFARPFNAMIETPGLGNVIRILNLGGGEFPLTAFVDTIVGYSTTPLDFIAEESLGSHNGPNGAPWI